MTRHQPKSPHFPSTTPFRSRDNLRLLAAADRRGDDKSPPLQRVLETVGLADRARDRVGAYSQGMKQRLAIAAALIREPRSEEHTSELQSRQYLVCRLLLEKK